MFGGGGLCVRGAARPVGLGAPARVVRLAGQASITVTGGIPLPALRSKRSGAEVLGCRVPMAMAMVMTDPDRAAAADGLLVSRMRAWADFEDRSEPAADEVVARELPELLELAEAFPPSPREPLLFPPFAGGPAHSSR